MANTVILALVDGMRPDGLLSCGHPFVNKLIAASASTMEGRTCFPSVTLPCHMSLFHSVDPERHGILTNTYVPQVRPIDGLIDQLDKYGKRSAMFYTWEELRDLARPGHAHKNVYVNLHSNPDSDCMITDEALSFMAKDHVDFLFLYLGETDEVGHDKGWMSDEYISAVRKAVELGLKKLEHTDIEKLLRQYNVIGELPERTPVTVRAQAVRETVQDNRKAVGIAGGAVATAAVATAIIKAIHGKGN